MPSSDGNNTYDLALRFEDIPTLIATMSSLPNAFDEADNPGRAYSRFVVTRASA